jgi:hypothetical protein
MADTMQRTLLMGVDETGQPTPMPIKEGGGSSTANVTTMPDLDVATMPDLDVATMPSLTIGSMPALVSTDGSTERLLSGSTNGKAIKVAATATAGTLLHTGVTGTSQIDWVSLYAVNSDTTDRKLTIEWGEATAPDGNIELTIPAEDGLVQITPDGGLPINNGLEIRAFAASANVICIHGKVRRK